MTNPFGHGNGGCRHAWPRRVVVAGAAGTVGAAVTSLFAQTGVAETIFAVDADHQRLRAHVLDISESLVAAGVSETRIIAADMNELSDVDLAIVTASVAEDARVPRHDFASANCDLVAGLLPAIARAIGGRGVLLIVTNPVDVVADVVRRLGLLAPHRIIGYSLNDCIRLRIAVGRELGIDPRRIDAWSLGEHGKTQVPLFSRMSVDGQSIHLPAESRARVTADFDGWFSRWAAFGSGRSSGWTTAAGVVHVCRCLMSGGLVAASVASGGAYGLPDVCLTLPARIGQGGLLGVQEWPVDPGEAETLRSAAASVRDAVSRIVPASVAR